MHIKKLVITKGCGVRATTIEGQNAFAPSLCFAPVSFTWQKVKPRVIRLTADIDRRFTRA